MPHIQVSQVGKTGYITLDRPEALNSLSHEMISDIHGALRAHEQDSSVEVIVIRSSSSRAFCAGGDMKATRLLAIDEEWEKLNRFFAEEYALNLHISQCSKPYVSMISGIAMGGGLGLSVHGSVVVVSETAVLAMPETAIGFFPDVGGTYFLSQLPYNAGMWVSLTGMPVKGVDAVTIGLATHYLEESKWAEFLNSIEEHGKSGLEGSLKPIANPADSKEGQAFIEVLKKRQAWFEASDHQSLIDVLEAETDPDAQTLLKRLNKMSPYAMDYTRQLLKDAQGHELVACLKRELAAAREMVRHPDFTEGIRAVLVDKDEPKWQ